jgi:hypothetical protein
VKKAYWIGAGVVAAAVVLYLMRDKLSGIASALGVSGLIGDTAPGAAAQLAGRAIPGKGKPSSKGSTLTNQQQVAMYGQSSPNGTLQTISGAIAIGSQGLGLFSQLRDAFPELGGDDGSNPDPSSVQGNWMQPYDAPTAANLSPADLVSDALN